jgi:hypothetical protein
VLPSLEILFGLLWKEWRNSVKLLLALGLGACAGVGIGAVSAASSGTIMSRYWRGMMGVVAFLLPLAAAGLLGANAFAGERAQQAEPFLDSLPVRKLSAGLLKVAFSLLLLFLLNALLWYWAQPEPSLLAQFRENPSLGLTILGMQMLVFGLCFLSSALSDRPIRALLRAPLLAFFILWPLALAGLSLLVLAAAHSPEVRPESVFCVEPVFDGALIAAGMLLIGIPFLIERRKPHFGRDLMLVVLLALPLPVMLLPAIQFYRLWGKPGFQQLIGAYDLGDDPWAGTMGLVGACMVGSALILEARNWLGRGIKVVWAAVASVSWVTGGCLLFGWPAAVLGQCGRLSIGEEVNSGYVIASGTGEHLVAMANSARKLTTQEHLSAAVVRESRGVVLMRKRGQAVRLPTQMHGWAYWSPDERYVALPCVRNSGLLSWGQPHLALFDTETSAVRVAGISRGIWVHHVGWRADSKSFVCLGVNHPGYPQLFADQGVMIYLHEVSTSGHGVRTRRIAQWDTAPFEIEHYRAWPKQMACDGEDVLAFLEPVPWSAQDDHFLTGAWPTTDAPGFTLLRIDTETGRVRPDPAFERLKQTVKGRAPGGDAVNYSWRRPPWSFMGPRNNRIVYVTRFGVHSRTRWLEIWRLGEGDEPNQLLLEDEEMRALSAVFLDDQTCVFARRKGNDPKAGCEWEVIRRTVLPAQDVVLLRVPLAQQVSILSSPSGKRFVVSSEWLEPGGGPQTNCWFATAEGAVSLPLTNFLPFDVFYQWTPDESTFLFWYGSKVDAACVEWSGNFGIPLTRGLIDFGQHPGLGYPLTSCDMAFSADSLYGLTADYPVAPNREVRLCRIDLQTGKPEVMLRFDGNRWVGYGGVTVKEAKVR